jgi:hypothetical protein
MTTPNTPPVSAAASEKARKSHFTFLQAVKDPGRQAAIATAMGVSETTVSRIKTEQSEQFCLLLACAGLKIVEEDKECVNPKTWRALAHIASLAMKNPDIAEQLLKGD